MTVSASPEPGNGAVMLDASQESAVRAAREGDVLVVGAPGTGKTAVAVEVFVRELLKDAEPSTDVRHILLAPTRHAAAQLRAEVTSRLVAAGRGTHRGVDVHTPSAFAFGLVRALAASRGEPVPTLLTGAQQDQILSEILDGHMEGVGAALEWPEGLRRESMQIPAFRAELRDLIMRADEHSLGPDELVALGRQEGRPAWVVGGQLWREYLGVVQLADTPEKRGARYDSSAVLPEAAYALTDGFASPPRFGVVVVDDYQEASAGLAYLLGILQRQGARLVLTADPDVAVQTFRGAQPQLVGRASGTSGVGGFGAREVVLETVHGQAPALREVVRSMSERVPASGVVRHRLAAAAGGAAAAERDRLARGEQHGLRSAVFSSKSAETAFVARALREAHLYRGVPWEDLAVIVRSSSAQRLLEDGLASQQVPVQRGFAAMVLREEPAVRLLLDLIDGAVDPTEEILTSLLLGDLGGMDSISLRRLRRELRRRAGLGEFGEGVSIGEALVQVAVSPEGAASIADPVARPALERVAAAHTATVRALAVPGATHETVLWAAWESTGLAEKWRSEAIDRGSARADRALDAVIALFAAAENATERSGDLAAGEFVAQVRAQQLPTDSLARTGQHPGGVAVLTPAQAAGRRWSHVFVCGVEDGIWPNTRIRDTLFGAASLADRELGRIGLGPGADPERTEISARAAVLADEWRMFVSALSRARDHLTVTAVFAEEIVPSTFHRLVTERIGMESPEEPPGQTRLDLRGNVANLRSILDADPAPGDATRLADVAAQLLAALADAGEPGADPATWAGAAAPEDIRPLRPLDRSVAVSPSKVELASQCPLRWALESVGGRKAESVEASLGSLIHSIAADFPEGTLAELRQELDTRFGELGLPDGWISIRERARADKMIEHLASYIASRAAEGVTEVRVEYPVHQQVGEAVISGSIDRVEVAQSSERVVDLKTGGKAISAAEAEANPQMGMYQLALQAASGGAQSGGATLVYVGTSNISVTSRTQNPLEPGGGWARELLDATVDIMREKAFAAVAGSYCRHCPVRTSCPVQREGERCGA